LMAFAAMSAACEPGTLVGAPLMAMADPVEDWQPAVLRGKIAHTHRLLGLVK
jgi:hypothetical protein